jgi:hyperosmotically inducible protein
MRWPTLLLALSLTLASAADQKDKQVSDDRIHDQVLMKLAGDQDVRGGGVEVEVKDGVVTLKGKVDSQKRKERAEKLVKKIKGVTAVTNEIVVTK